MTDMETLMIGRDIWALAVAGWGVLMLMVALSIDWQLGTIKRELRALLREARAREARGSDPRARAAAKAPQGAFNRE